MTMKNACVAWKRLPTLRQRMASENEVSESAVSSVAVLDTLLSIVGV